MLVGETPEQTIAREVLEELGRQVKLHHELGQAIQFFYAGDEECWYKMAACFFAAELQGEADGHGEYEIQWVDPILKRSDFFHECHVWAAFGAAR